MPSPKPGLALIDTGASSTCVDETMVTDLGVQPVDVVKISTPSGTDQRSVYPASLAFPGTNLPSIDFPRLIGVDLSSQAIAGTNDPMVALFGRDLLRMFVLVYNGPAGMYSLSY
jgi:hypothetical protein